MSNLPENRFYVYLHIRNSDGRIFYIGKGTGYRAWETRFRNKRHSEILNSNNYSVIIYKDKLKEHEALSLELNLIDQHKDTIVNKATVNSTKKIDANLVKDYLYYDETSPSCLRWKRSNGAGVRASDIAGYVKSDGYFGVKIEGKLYYAHRLVMELFDFCTCGFDVDHIDRNKQNNTISNLRLVSRSENNSNKQISVRTEYVKIFKYYSVLNQLTGKVRRFSVTKLGEELAFEQATLYLKSVDQEK